MLNTLSKLYEALIRTRLEKELEQGERLSSNQYGFRRGRSTIEAIQKVFHIKESAGEKWVALVTLDVKNASYTASWSIIRKELEKNIFQDMELGSIHLQRVIIGGTVE